MAKCVLIVDDDEGVRDSLRQYLEELGYQVVTAQNPGFCQAVSLESSCPLENRCCDIIIIDFSMPKMNGLDFLEGRANRLCKGSAIPAALMSGFLPEDGEKRLKDIGCTFFPKPVHFSTILKWIESLPE